MRSRTLAARRGHFIDTDEKSIAMMRVPYEIDETLRKINAADLPEWLGIRLKEGR